MTSLRPWICCGLWVALGANSVAQDHWLTKAGSNGELLGSKVIEVEDLDGDGRPDFAAAAHGTRADQTGKVVVSSGVDGSEILTISGRDLGEGFGFDLSTIGNLDGDARPDLIIAAPRRDAERGHVGVFSSATGAAILELDGPAANSRFGAAVCAAGDINGDTVPDFAVGAPFDDGGRGSVFLYSGLDGGLIRKLSGVSQIAPTDFGLALCKLGDVTGDGVPELAVGAPNLDTRSHSNAGGVQVFSGADGSFVFARNGGSRNGRLGSALTRVESLNGDPHPDLLASEPGTGIVELISGTDGSLIAQFQGSSPDHFGFSLCSPGDLDHDGMADIVIGSLYGGNGFGEVTVWSGRTFQLLHSFVATSSQESFGYSVAGIDDVDGDGQFDLVVGSPWAGGGGTNDGAVTIYRMLLAGSRTYGEGYPGTSVPELTSVLPPKVNKPQAVFIGNGWNAPCTAVLFLGLQETDTATSWGGDLLVVPFMTLVLPIPTAGLTLTGLAPDDPDLYGFQLYLQALEFEHGGSRAVAFTPGLLQVFGY